MAKQGKPRACVFCKRRPPEVKISKEHVWPKWLRPFIEIKPGKQSHTRSHLTREGQVLRVDEWDTAPLNWQVSAPCSACNEGWMENLETAVRPYLIPMLEDRNLWLDAKGQTTLAQWATLRVLMSQHGQPPRLARAVASASYRKFYESLALPGGAQIWIGRYDGSGPWPTALHHSDLHVSRWGLPAPTLPNGYAVAFSVGYAAFLYWGHEIKDGPLIDIGGLREYFVPIWPTSERVSWPPRGALGASGLTAALDRLPAE